MRGSAPRGCERARFQVAAVVAAHPRLHLRVEPDAVVAGAVVTDEAEFARAEVADRPGVGEGVGDGRAR